MKKVIHKVIYIILLITVFISCSNKNKKYIYNGFAQGTSYHIAYYSSVGEVINQPEIDSILNDFNNSCSLYDSNSLLTRINSNKTDSLDQHIEKCINAAYFFNKISDGLYDITIKPLTEAYGFTGDDEKGHDVNLKLLLPNIGMNKIKIKDSKLIKLSQKIELDLNSIAQGYSVDLLSKYISSKGVTDYIVELGGEIYASGDNQKQGWKVGIDKPIDNSYIAGQNLQAVIIIENKGLTTSGNYRKFYTTKKGERINHIINPKTGKSNNNNMLSVTVIAENAMLADGYTTSFMLMGKDKSIEYLNNNKNIDALLVYTENGNIKTYTTQGLQGRLEILN